ncbi:glycosyl hydrolase family 61-domain-containing protein [Cercophora scortea]|uniref:lytic cellulose monooxygenase (C4-dehydrogenating) n=1 Tax=Cercophora scortea TaxID=314031 RepID=A0AAE0IW52_9PEZI|nr:glycosyl hydrolase family 61-domain-containing protein [Cercophora scortea]
MPSILALLLAAGTSLLPSALAHSHINYLIINGLLYPGYDPTGRTHNRNSTVGWSTTAADDGFVPPSNYSSPDIICHVNGAPALAHAPVPQGAKIHLQWNGWPQSHHGPVLSYLAPCNSATGCSKVNKTALEWTKIDNSFPALVDETPSPPGDWATDTLIASNNSWLVGIPANLAPGPYVLRHEIIALHYANRKDGAQNYPQCVNLWVHSAQGVATPTKTLSLGAGLGTPATKLYKSTDAGVAVDIYTKLGTYVIPGPTVVAGVTPVPLAQQRSSVPTADGTPVLVMAGKTVPFPEPTGR